MADAFVPERGRDGFPAARRRGGSRAGSRAGPRGGPPPLGRCAAGGPGRAGSGLARLRRPAAAALVFAAACGADPANDGGAAGLRLEGEALGTRWMVRVRGGEAPEAGRGPLTALVGRELDSVDRAMSNWREDSELSRLNADGGRGPAAVSGPLAEVLAAALEVHRDSGGAFDITVAPLLRLYGFGPDGTPSAPAPDPAALAEARARVGSGRLSLEPPLEPPLERAADGGGILHRGAEGIELDLSGIAKGYAVDRISAALAAAGFPEHLVEVGGEIRTQGTWTVGVETPLVGGGPRVRRSFPAADTGVATSGGYRDFREAADGSEVPRSSGAPTGTPAGERRYWTHLFDPRSGRPVERRSGSVTVLAPSCLLADAWATALFVLGPEAGYDLARERGLAALFLTAAPDGTVEERATPGFPGAADRSPD